jgi:hypothetical protein
MNHHEFADVAAIRLSGLLTRDQKLFERSLDVPPLVDVTPDAEAVRVDLAERSDALVVLVGTSLGGFAANLHRTCFGTADRYVPLLAGAAFGQLFVSSFQMYQIRRKNCRRKKN